MDTLNKDFAGKDFAHKDFDRKMMEIGYIGAFYGLVKQAHAIFSFYGDGHAQNRTTQIAARLGSALTFISEHNYHAAADLLEKDLAQFNDSQLLEAKVFLILVYKKAKVRADRVDALIDELKGTLSGPVADAVKVLAAG